MECVKDVASLSGVSLDERKSILEERIRTTFDPAGILFSVILTFAIKQLIAWIEKKIKNKELGDDE